ncbi:hypothetical protein [Pleomorphomonas sp. NRK KF1]|uniref:hypothetical protein n=1 Tax=Pleomorphomonas sp. NRK KF1 TaxID=2943000 RepID=UPI0020448B45|nr:hypothetical protein [Pleomorphomonas sp. NRK KF1]MCM5554009.1 hypothetical protein [Pleomorphomonas sp. NRK KF1]
MLGLLNKLGATVAAIAGLVVGAAITFAALSLYDAWIDDPAVARAAREGFVAASEKLALEGQIQEMRRQFKLAETAAASDRARAEAASRDADDAWKRYEAAVAADGGDDGCRVTDGDLGWLRNARPAPHGGIK